MTEQFYLQVGAMSALVAYIPTLLFIALWIGSFMKDFVADTKTEHPPKFITVVNDWTLSGIWCKVFGINPISDYRWADMVFTTIFFDLMIAFLFILFWPIMVVYVGVMLILLLLRTLARLGRKVGSLAKVAHTHPKSVEHTPYND